MNVPQQQLQLMHRQRLWVLFGGMAWIAFFSATLSIPASPDPAPWPQAASIFVGISILLAILLASERPYWPVFMRWGILGGGLLMVLVPYFLHANAPIVRAFVALGLVMVAVPVGYWLGEKMEKITNLIPLAIGMSMADIFSVTQFVSAKAAKDLAEHQEEVAQVVHNVTAVQGAVAGAKAGAAIQAPLWDFIIVHMPLAGTAQSNPVLGIGDFVILAFIFRSAWVHQINPAAVFWPGLISTLAALGLAQVFSVSMPALPFIALGTVGYLWFAYPRIRKLDRQEKMLSVVVFAVFLALMAYRWLAAMLGL